MKMWLLIFLLITPVFIYSQDPMQFQRLEDYNLKGKVKQYVRASEYEIDTLVFNEEGYLTESKRLNLIHNEFYFSSYTYKNNKVVSSVYSKDSKINYYEYFYDSLGRYIYETCNGKIHQKLIYDNRGNEIETFSFTKDTIHMIQVFDQENRLLERSVDWKDDWRDSKTYFWYTDSFDIQIITRREDDPLMIVSREDSLKETEWFFDFNSFPYPMVRSMTVRLLNQNGLVIHYSTQYFMPRMHSKESMQPGYIESSYYTHEFDPAGNVVKYIKLGENGYTDTQSFIYYE